MMNHLREIEDAAARDGVNAYKTQMEVVVLSLLNPDPVAALIQIEEARITSLDHINAIGAPSLAAGAKAKAKASRIAVGMLEHSFERIRIVIESPDEDPPGDPH